MNIFPPGIAEGDSFCNRVLERKSLSENINDISHTVITAPRRYGKSSLIKKVVSDLKINHAWTDFLTVSSKKEVENKIGKAVAQLLYELAPDLKKLQINFQKFFKTLHPDVVIQALGASLSIHPNFEKNIEIDEALLGLDAYAQELGKKAVIVFDEFQEISMLQDHKVIEALIRHAVERSKAITYIFSGSNRHLLIAMFGSKDRPLYRLCQTVTIDRIKQQDYHSFLNEAAQEQWKAPLNEKTFQCIMQLTEQHPYYVNALCRQLWKLETLPTEKDALKAWEDYITANRTPIISDIINLSVNQKRMISTLAASPTREISSKEFIIKSNLPASSIKQVLDVLMAKDIVYQDESGVYKLLDPAIRYYVSTH